MARDMYLVGVSEEDLKPDPKPEKPKTPKKKWENFWYHYKIHTIAAIAVLAVAAVLVTQMLQRNNPDYLLVLVTDDVIAQPLLNRLQAELEAAGLDLDGDGRVEVTVENLSMKLQGPTMGVGATKLQAHLATGDVMLFAFEPALYMQYIKDNERDGLHIFAPLGLETDGLTEEGRLWNWKDDGRRQADQYLKLLPENLYFGVRDTAGTAAKSTQLKEEGLALMRAFITDTPQPKPEVSSHS